MLSHRETHIQPIPEARQRFCDGFRRRTHGPISPRIADRPGSDQQGAVRLQFHRGYRHFHGRDKHGYALRVAEYRTPADSATARPMLTGTSASVAWPSVSADDHKRLGHEGHSDGDDLADAKATAQLPHRHQAEAGTITAEDIPASYVVVAEDPAAGQVRLAGQPRHERQTKVKLKRIPSIRRRDKPPAPDAHDLRCHLPLVFQTADVLNDRVAVDHVEMLIGPGKTARIGGPGVDLGKTLPDLAGVLLQDVHGTDIGLPGIRIDELAVILVVRSDLRTYIEDLRLCVRFHSLIEQLQLSPATDPRKPCEESHRLFHREVWSDRHGETVDAFCRRVSVCRPALRREGSQACRSRREEAVNGSDETI